MISYAFVPPALALVNRSYAMFVTSVPLVAVWLQVHELGIELIALNRLLSPRLALTFVYDLTPLPPPVQLHVVVHLIVVPQMD
jgi:hypothetical protein